MDEKSELKGLQEELIFHTKKLDQYKLERRVCLDQWREVDRKFLRGEISKSKTETKFIFYINYLKCNIDPLIIRHQSVVKEIQLLINDIGKGDANEKDRY